jgi:murein DD-endopeptidase MepM/ murein hydrolase activator NlpD
MAVFNRKELARIHADHASLLECYTTHVDAKPDIAFKQIPVQGEISTPFGARRYVNGEPRSPHTGVDIAAPAGTPIIAPLSGRVLLVRSMYLDGNTVAIGHGHGLVSVYCHLSKIDVKPGQWIESGSEIGEVGQTGRATGPNLHWGIRFENARISPLALLP